MELPSILDLERQLQRIELPQTDGERQAVRIARALLSHLRNFGTPQSAPMNPKLAVQSLSPRSVSVPMHLVRPRPQTLLGQTTSGFTASPSRPPARAASRPPAPPRPVVRNGVTLRQIAERAGFSHQHCANLLWAGVLPKPHQPAQGNQPAVWTEQGAAEALEILADPQRRKKPSTAKSKAEVPAHWVNAEQFAKRMGYSHANMIHHLVGKERIPPHEFTQGRRIYWAEETVATTVATYRRRQRTASATTTPKEPA